MEIDLGLRARTGQTTCIRSTITDLDQRREARLVLVRINSPPLVPIIRLYPVSPRSSFPGPSSTYSRSHLFASPRSQLFTSSRSLLIHLFPTSSHPLLPGLFPSISSRSSNIRPWSIRLHMQPGGRWEGVFSIDTGGGGDNDSGRDLQWNRNTDRQANRLRP